MRPREQTRIDPFVERGAPEPIHSGNGPEFCSKAVREWLRALGVETLFVGAGESVGERGQRELERQAAGRTPEPGDLLHAGGGQGADRELAAGVESSRKGRRLVGYVIHRIRRLLLAAQLVLGCPLVHIGRQGEPRP